MILFWWWWWWLWQWTLWWRWWWIFPALCEAEMNWYTYQPVISLPLWQTSPVCGDVNPIICPPPPSATNIDAIIDSNGSEVNLCDRHNVLHTCGTLDPCYPSALRSQLEDKGPICCLRKCVCGHICTILYLYTSSIYCCLLLGGVYSRSNATSD